MSTGRITAPFTEEQVEALNRWQKTGQLHPFTCPGDLVICNEAGRELIATTHGWECKCGAYRQTWAHGFMVDGE
jgi:hypothetical protein